MADLERMKNGDQPPPAKKTGPDFARLMLKSAPSEQLRRMIENDKALSKIHIRKVRYISF